jgi:hypothetical protein
MIAGFLSAQELTLMQLDMAELFLAADTVNIRISFSYHTGTEETDSVYHVRTDVLGSDYIIKPAIQSVLQSIQLEEEVYRFAKTGDCLLVFSEQLDFTTLKNKPVVKDSVVFTDPANVRWNMNIRATEDINRITNVNLHGTFLAQMIVVSPLREEA